MRLVILDSINEVEDYSRYNRNKNDIILPIRPSVREYSLRKNWEIIALGDLWKKEDYFKFQKESELKITKLVEELNYYSESLSNIFPLTIGNYFHFNLQIAIGMIHYNEFIVSSILKLSGLENVVLYSKKNECKLINNFWPDRRKMLFEIFNNYDPKKLEIYNGQDLNSRNLDKFTIKRLLKKILPYNVIKNIRFTKDLLKNAQLKNGGKKKLLFLGEPFDWEDLFSEQNFKRYYRLSHLRPDNYFPSNFIHSETVKKILDKSLTNKSKAGYDLSYQSDVISSAIHYFLVNYKKYIKYIKKFKGILTTVHTLPKESYMCQLANLMNVPVINWQHGEMSLYPDIFTESLETRYTNHYFCYGTDVMKYYKKWIGRSALKSVHNVGSTKKAIKILGRDTIVYPTAKWLNNTLYTTTSDPDTRNFNAQIIILKYLNSINSDQKVVVKANNGPNDMPYKGLNLNIEYEIPFTTLLSKAKMVILDAPGTTCIEVCSTEVPLFVLTGRSNWFEKPLRLLKKRAVVEDSAEALVKRVDQFLKNGDYPAELDNKEFLNGWGSVFSADQTKNNALEALNNII